MYGKKGFQLYVYLKESIIVAFAFVGVVVGAGFATGQIFNFLL